MEAVDQHYNQLDEERYDLDQIGSRNAEMWLESEYILNVEPAEFPDRLHIGCEKKTGVRMTLFFSA